MNNSIFETKFQYREFRMAFATAQNDKRAKPTFVEVTCSSYNWRTRETHSWMGKEKHKGWLTAEHFILLNAARGLPLNRGFSPAVKKGKITAYNNNPMRVFDDALKSLRLRQEDAKVLIEGAAPPISAFLEKTLSRLNQTEKDQELAKMRKDKNERLQRLVNVILEPLNGTLTLQQFASLDFGGEK